MKFYLRKITFRNTQTSVLLLYITYNSIIECKNLHPCKATTIFFFLSDKKKPFINHDNSFTGRTIDCKPQVLDTICIQMTIISLY